MTADATQLRLALGSWAQQVQDQATDVTVGLVRFTGDVPNATGELRGAIAKEGPTVDQGQRFRSRIIAPVIQAATTDKGARAHVIRPRRAGGVLRFNWPKAGGVVVLRHVNHPGNPPRPWWQRAIEREYAQALRLAARMVPFR